MQFFSEIKHLIQKEAKPIKTFLVVGDNHAYIAGSIEVFNRKTKKLEDFHELNLNSSEFSANVLGEDLLIFGGEKDDHTLNEVWSLNLRNKTVAQLPSMNEKRANFTSTVIDGKIYVCGGRDDSLDPINSVEVWDRSSPSWKNLTSMTLKRGWHSAAGWNGKVYIFGGFSWKDGYLTSVEVYNPESNSWSKCAPMKKGLSNCAVTVLKDLIYVMGGKEHWNDFKSVNVYNPKDNIWTTSIDLPLDLRGPSAVTMDDKILLSGQGMVYEFDPDAKEWKWHSHVRKTRSFHNMLIAPDIFNFAEQGNDNN